MPIPEPVPDLAALDLLVSVGQVGSISSAAAVHGVTQPAASMRLRQLERVLGIELLERSHAGARLTPAGLSTVEWAGPVLHAVRALQVGVAALKQASGARLDLAASLTVADYLLPGWLHRLAGAEPALAVSLRTGNTARVAEMVADGEAEVGFIEGTKPSGRFASRDLCQDRLVIVVSPTHPWARRRSPVTAGMLARTPIVVREVGSGTRDVLAAALATHGTRLSTTMELGSTAAIKAAVMGGTGPAVLSYLAVERELRSGELVSVTCRDLDLKRTIRAIWPGGRPPGAAGRKLVQLAADG